MPDISMCQKQDCPSFHKCYRAQAIPNPYRQAYMEFDNKGGTQCADYIPPIEERRQLLEELAAESQRLGLYGDKQ
jgi:hypothetical protein